MSTNTQLTLPSPTLDGLTFFPVPEFDDLAAAFGAEADAYFDRYKRPKVPQELVDMANKLFFRGGALPEMSPRVDRAKATKAVRAWLCSFNPSHESKETTVAYALWVWTTLDQSNPQPPAP